MVYFLFFFFLKPFPGLSSLQPEDPGGSCPGEGRLLGGAELVARREPLPPLRAAPRPLPVTQQRAALGAELLPLSRR